MTNLDAIGKEWESEASTSDFFKFPTGKSRVRILTDFMKVESIYQGEYPNTKYLGIKTADRVIKEGETVSSQAWAWALVRGEDGFGDELKIVQFGKALIEALINLKSDPDYAFESFPMPYDITVHNTGSGPTRYSITAARQNTEVTEREMEALNKKQPIHEIVAKIVAKQNGGKKKEDGGSIEYPKDAPNPEDIPF